MKRYLIKGALALIAGLFITSCSHETEVDFVPIQDQRTQEFDKAFKEAFTSNIAPNQDWGFSTANYLSSRAGTRGTRGEVVKPDMTNYPSSIAPGPLEAGEAEYVTDWFSKNPGFSHETLTWTNYFVQHVSYKQQERGIWYHRDPLHPENDWDEVKTYNFTLDQLKVGSDQTHVYDYNATQCANGAIADTRYIKGSDTNDFSVLISWATSNESHLYKLAKITYNGKTNYYVGFTAWGENSNNGTEELGAQRKTYCDDWIIKIVPGEGQTIPEGPDTPGTEVTPPASETEHYTAKHRTTKTEYFKKRILLDYGRVFCEDLGGNYNSNRKDFDYNDVVFDAYLYKEVEYKRETVYDTYEVTVKWRGHLPKMENGNYVYNNGQLVYEENESEIEISKYTSEPEYVSGPIESPVEGSDDRATFKADICLIACGATKPVKVGSTNDANEVHKAFGGYSVDCMINTFDENTEKGGGFGYHVVAEPVGPEDYSGVFRLIDITNQVTDKNDPSIADIPIYVQWDNISATKVVAEMGAVPQKFMSRDKDNWTSERCFLGDAYPSFTNWVSRPDYKFSTGADGGYLYSGYPGPSAGLPFSESLRNQTENLEVTRTTYPSEERSELVRVEYTDVMPDDFNFSSETTPGGNTQEGGSGNNGNNGNNGKTLWANANGTMLNWGGDISIDKSKFASATSSSKLRFYGECTNPSNWQIYLKDQNWSDIVAAAGHWISNDLNNTGYVEFVIGNYLSQLKNGGVLVQGSGFKLTQVDLIR